MAVKMSEDLSSTNPPGLVPEREEAIVRKRLICEDLEKECGLSCE